MLSDDQSHGLIIQRKQFEKKNEIRTMPSKGSLPFLNRFSQEALPLYRIAPVRGTSPQAGHGDTVYMRKPIDTPACEALSSTVKNIVRIMELQMAFLV